MTTTASAAAHTCSRTRRWFVVGSLRTVCATTTIGTSISAISSMIDSPSGPSYKPYSCWTMTTSAAFNASVAAARCAGVRPSSDATTRTSSSSGDGPIRTTSTEQPVAIRPADRAAENVAIPHDVGGNVDRIPKDRPWLSPGVTGGTEMAVCTTELLDRPGRDDRPAEGDSATGRPAQAGRTRPRDVPSL